MERLKKRCVLTTDCGEIAGAADKLTAMKAVILAGGKGTRLREETEYKPKPMVEVGGRPIIWHIMKTYASYGVTEFIVCLGYKGGVIRDYFLNYQTHNSDFRVTLGKQRTLELLDDHLETGWNVTLAETGEDTMTGGRVKAIEKYIDDEPFCVTYGDGLGDVNIGDLIKFHNDHRKIATVTTIRPPSRYGLIEADETGKARNFIEKPTLDGWVNGGYFVFNRGIFDYLTDEDCVLEQTPLQQMTKDGELFAFHHTGFWQAMDTYRESQILNEMWEKGAPWKVW